MQFRKEKHLCCRIISDNDPCWLAAKVETFGEKVIFEDLQYSTTTRESGQIEYSVFVIYKYKEQK